MLGVVRKNKAGRLTFVASHRRLPHVGSPVAFLSDEVLREIAGHNVDGAAIGHFALGEYIYAKGSKQIEVKEWMQIKSPEVLVKFPISNLVSRRSFIFARAGYGKSNLNKLIFSELYREIPTVTKRANTSVPVGTVIFDPDGEYFWPDDKGRPGLCDVPHLQDKLVVFTSRKNPSQFYQSFVAGGVRLDIRRLRPADVIAITVGTDRQDQQNVRKLRGLDPGRWERLVNMIDETGNGTPLAGISEILDLELPRQDAEALAARANMTAIVRMLHDRGSQLMDMLIHALSQGRLCVIDVSQMRGAQALMLSGLILRRIFDRNQLEFTSATPRTIPTIAVVEEAQSVLNENATSSEPYIAWVKEGRKYDLGAVLITQQPGSIPVEILSQGDNWFIFHLLSASDLTNLKKANAHFSEDLLSALLNEPIPGQGVFWSSVAGTPYPISIRGLSFERTYPVMDAKYDRAGVETFATHLAKEFQNTLEHATGVLIQESSTTSAEVTEESVVSSDDVAPDTRSTDALGAYERKAIDALRNDETSMSRLKGEGLAWGSVKALLKKNLPGNLDNLDDIAFHLVPKALNEIFGSQRDKWHDFKKNNSQGRLITYVKAGRNETK